jgi:hypothetical protein
MLSATGLEFRHSDTFPGLSALGQRTSAGQSGSPAHPGGRFLRASPLSYLQHLRCILSKRKPTICGWAACTHDTWCNPACLPYRFLILPRFRNKFCKVANEHCTMVVSPHDRIETADGRSSVRQRHNLDKTWDSICRYCACTVVAVDNEGVLIPFESTHVCGERPRALLCNSEQSTTEGVAKHRFATPAMFSVDQLRRLLREPSVFQCHGVCIARKDEYPVHHIKIIG